MPSIIIAGDLIHTNALEQVQAKEYPSRFGDMREYIESADYSIVNLEAPIINSTPTPIKKCGPNLYSSSKVVDLIRFMGFDCVTLANNHFFDQGMPGVISTLHACDNAGISHLGGDETYEKARAPLYITIGKTKVALINCCEIEFSIATHSHGGSNPLKPISVFYDIQEAKRNADYVIVITHGGIELFELPTITMQETFRFLIDAGADAVINHHQHRPSGYEIYNGKVIAYGLGNFCYPKAGYSNGFWNYGHLIKLNISDKTIQFDVIPYKQCNNVEVSVVPLKGKELEAYMDEIGRINNIIRCRESLESANKTFMQQTEQQFAWLVQPFTNKYLRALQRRFMPRAMSEHKIDELLSIMNCQSHYERFLEFLKNHTSKQL